MGRFVTTAAAAAAVFFLGACSQAPTATEAKTEVAAKEPPAPTGPVTAKTAFYEMYKPARAWAPDFALLSLASKEVPGIVSDGGKFGAWTAVFVSPSRNEAHTYTYSVAASGTAIHKGVDDEGTQTWSGPTNASRPFQTMDWTVDSDAAYQTSAAKAQSWIKNHPGKTPAFTLANASRFPTPVWYILWGTKTSGYASLISASTGSIVKAK